MPATRSEPTPPTKPSLRLAEAGAASATATGGARIALIGNPNAGKTTLFNSLTGRRAKTANFPGTTVELRTGRCLLGEHLVEVLDLPGLYSIESDTPDERLARRVLTGAEPRTGMPDAVLILLDATQLERNLYLASQVLEHRRPTVVALNMIDLAERSGIQIDVDALARELGCPVIPIAARNGRGLPELRERLAEALAGAGPAQSTAASAACNCAGCPFQARFDWAEEVGRRCNIGSTRTHQQQTERIDRVLTHPWVGLGAFLSVMASIFALIFWMAQYPMDWIEWGFATAGSVLGTWLPQGEIRSLVVDGVFGGVGGVLVFLPQIWILFFFLALLEDTGYLARAAFVMDRLMQRVGLPGKAFVPLLSAHACAIPAIMATRVIEDRRDRLVTILVLPLLSCSARIPVFAMLTAMLFPTQPLAASLVFTGAYGLGLFAALGMAFLLKRTVLPGETRPLVLELPGYKWPSLRTAWFVAFDRGRIFLVSAGTVILVLSIVMWALATFPRSAPPASATALLGRSEALLASGQPQAAEELRREAEVLTARHSLEQSLAGRAGRLIEPAIEPLGFDWQIGIGLISSFAAREVIVSTLAIVYGVGEDVAAERPESLQEKLAAARRSDGSPVFTPATNVSLLLFYILAMQCMSTLAVSRRETGGWRWPAFQFAYMTALAYGAAFVGYRVLSAMGLG